MLDLEVLEYGFDHDVARREVRNVRRSGEPRHDVGDLRIRELAALDRFREETFGLLTRTLERVPARIEHDGPEARTRGDDRDAGAHGATAGNTYSLDIHVALRSLDEATANQLPVDLVRAFPDLRDLRIAHEPLDTIVLAIAIAAVELHRIRRNAHREIRSAQLEHGRFDGEIGRAAVDQRRDVPQPTLTHREVGCHVREHELYALKLDDTPSGLPAFVDVE